MKSEKRSKFIEKLKNDGVGVNISYKPLIWHDNMDDMETRGICVVRVEHIPSGVIVTNENIDNYEACEGALNQLKYILSSPGNIKEYLEDRYENFRTNGYY